MVEWYKSGWSSASLLAAEIYQDPPTYVRHPLVNPLLKKQSCYPFLILSGTLTP